MNRYFTANVPSTHDEDAEPFADSHIAVICDGLGGSGQNLYTFEEKKCTSAALGSMTVSLVFREYFKDTYFDIFNNQGINIEKTKDIIENFKKFLSNKLNNFVADYGFVNKVKGRSMQMLPTTLASVIYKEYEDYIGVLVISAGDSRAYCITHDKGLQQLSIDDIEEEMDAFQKATTMTNNISQDHNYYLHYNYYKLPKDCIVFVSSDGCFDYLDNPMYYEFMICSAITNAPKNNDSENENFIYVNNWLGISLEKEIKLRNLQLNDDCTIAGFIFGYDNNIRESFYQRGKLVHDSYIKPLRNIESSISATYNHQKNIEDLNKKRNNILVSQKEKIRDEISKFIYQDICSECETVHNKYYHFLTYSTDYRKFKTNQKNKLEIEIKKSEQEINDIYSELLICFKEVYLDYKTREIYEIKKTGNSKLIRTTEIQKTLLDFKTADDECKEKFKSLRDLIDNFISKGMNDSLEAFWNNLTSQVKDCSHHLYSLSQRNAYREKIEKDYQKKIIDSTNFENELAKLVNNSSGNSINEYRKCKTFSKFASVYNEYNVKLNSNKMLAQNRLNDVYDACVKKYTNTDFNQLWEKITCTETCKQTIFDKNTNNELRQIQIELSNLSKLNNEIEKNQKSKLNFWQEYRTNYELFKSCNTKGVVN